MIRNQSLLLQSKNGLVLLFKATSQCFFQSSNFALAAR